MRLLISAVLALAGIAYLVIQFREMARLDAAGAATEGPAHDAETVAWLQKLRTPDSEFDEWCEQAFALTRDPADADLKLWERELGGAS